MQRYTCTMGSHIVGLPPIREAPLAVADIVIVGQI